MRILVVGAGATGGYFGGLLARAGRDVTFLVRSTRAEALQETGLTAIGSGGEWTIKPDVVTPEELAADPPGAAEDAVTDDAHSPYDVVLLAVKAYSLDDAIDDVAPAVGPDTVVVPGLNGLAHMDVLDATFGRDRVLGGVMYVATTLDDTGRIVQLNPGLNALSGVPGMTSTPSAPPPSFRISPTPGSPRETRRTSSWRCGRSGSISGRSARSPA